MVQNDNSNEQRTAPEAGQSDERDARGTSGTEPRERTGQRRSRRRRRPANVDGGMARGQGPGTGQPPTAQAGSSERPEPGQPGGHERREPGQAGRGQGRGMPQGTGQGRQGNSGGGDQNRTQGGSEKPSGPGRRPPVPQGPRRPRSDDTAPERIEPSRARHAPAAPGTPREGRSDRAQGGEDRRRPPRARLPEATGRATPAAGGPGDRLRVIPLGGVGEVGKNMTAVEYGQDLILLDCGGKFPEEEQRGIDLIIPDVSYVRERLRNLRAIVITHGHEDHIGGLPYVLPQIADAAPIPIYGSPLALGFIERKLLEARLDKTVDLRPVQPGDRVQFGALEVEFIHVTHSIPDTNAVAVHSPVGTILDTADFKFDPTPVMGAPTDERRLRRMGDEGVLALFSDTVRVETDGSTPSERVVLEKIDATIKEAKGMVVIATFASNISRIYMALKAAQKYGRKVAVAGRSMEQNARVAQELGYLDPPEGLMAPLDEVLKLPKQQRVLVITGSQGEAAAALARIAAAEHPKIRIGKGDVVLLSATPIPGNEETVTRTIDNLFRRGARVVYSARDRGVHVSGHAGRDELRRMLDLLRPKFAVPIHGEFRHMVLYRELCAQAGISADRVLLPEIGGVLEFTRDTAAQRGKVRSGSILVDRLGDRGNGQVQLRDREHLADDGVVVVTIVVDRETGELIAGPDLIAKGLKPELQNGALREAEQDLRRTLERRGKGEPQYGHLMQRAKETVGKSLYRRSKSRPMILPVVTEL